MTAKNVSLLFAFAESFLLVAQIFNVILRSKDKSRVRFLILIASFIAFNLLSVMIPDALGSDTFKTKLFTHLSGFLITSSYLHYIVKEYNVFDQILDTSNSLYGVVLTLFASFISSFFFLGTSYLAREVLITLPIIVSVAICIYTHIHIRKTRPIDRQTSFILYSAYVGVILMTSFPFVIHQNVCNEINVSLINGAFILLAGTYFYQLWQENRKQQMALIDYGYYADQIDIEKYDLTVRELEIARMILNEKSYQEIADSFYISIGTVTKHASNIFKKTGCKNREEFSKKFKQDN